MNVTKKEVGGVFVAAVTSAEPILTDVQSALDLIATVNYETDCYRIVLNKEAVSEAFFDLKTRVAGEILQKFTNYGITFAVYGDFSPYKSRALNDFIYECNKGSRVFFLPDLDTALARVAGAK